MANKVGILIDAIMTWLKARCCAIRRWWKVQWRAILFYTFLLSLAVVVASVLGCGTWWGCPLENFRNGIEPTWRIFVVFGGIYALRLAHQRTQAADTQAETATDQFKLASRSSQAQRYEKASEMLWNQEDVGIRIAGCVSLMSLGRDDEEMAVQCRDLLVDFIVHSSAISQQGKGEQKMQDRADIAKVDRALSSLYEKWHDKKQFTDFLLNVIPSWFWKIETSGFFRRNYSGANFLLADLIGADFFEATLIKASLQQAKLKCADLAKADLTDANLTDAKLMGADLTDANLTGAKLVGAYFIRADLTDDKAILAKPTSAKFIATNLTGADLTRANLMEAKLMETNLRHAKLIGANLTKADLMGAKLYPAKDSEGELIATKLIGADLTDATLIRADLTGVDFNRAILKDADLSDADFIGDGSEEQRAKNLTPEQIKSAVWNPTQERPKLPTNLAPYVDEMRI